VVLQHGAVRGEDGWKERTLTIKQDRVLLKNFHRGDGFDAAAHANFPFLCLSIYPAVSLVESGNRILRNLASPLLLLTRRLSAGMRTERMLVMLYVAQGRRGSCAANLETSFLHVIMSGRVVTVSLRVWTDPKQNRAVRE